MMKRNGAGVRAMAFVVLAFAIGACVSARDAFTTTGFSTGYGYDLRYRSRDQLLPETWRLDNFRRIRDRWSHKDHGRYVSTYKFDEDDDGSVDLQLDMFTYALRFENRANTGMIWLRHIPVTWRDRGKELRVLAGPIAEAVVFGRFEHWPAEERPPSSRIRLVLDPGTPVTVAGLPGWAVTVNVVDVDVLQVDARAIQRRIQLVLMYAPQDETVSSGETTSKLKGNVQVADKHLPVVVVAGYENAPRDFAAGFGDFQDFLNQITIAGKSGVSPIRPAEPAPATDVSAMR